MARATAPKTPVQDRIARLIRPELRRAEAYTVPEASGLIKLDAMENPYPWPAELKQAWFEMLARVELNRYPDPRAQRLKRRLREVFPPPAGTELLLGNGSDELIQIILLALAGAERYVLAPVPTFVMYEVIARAVGMRFVGVPLAADFALDLPAMRAALARYRPAVTFVANPNNPTGNLFARAALETIVREAEGLVVIDEAYFAFTEESFMDRLADFDNLLVLRTLSKLGLAGLRLGWLVGDPAWLAEFDKLRLPYNINSLTQASAEYALGERAMLDEQVARVRSERERLYAALARLPGVHPWPSETNFILFRIESRAAADVHATLLRGGVLVKNLDPMGDALAGCLRVTVGTAQENAVFMDALKRALA